MKISNRDLGFKFASLLAPAMAVAMLSGCNSGAAGSADNSAPASSQVTGMSQAQTGGSPAAANVVGDSCVSGDANKICLGIHFVTYQDSNGAPVASQEQAKTIIKTMNQLWSQCNIGFQIDQYDVADPAKHGLSYGAASQDETQKIRDAFSQPSNEMLAVTTGPWGTAVNAWTSMPGEAPYGAVMEASIVDYGNGIIYAHEFGHYLGLDHVSDSSDLMNPVIATDSSKIDSTQCKVARDTATSYWASMIRK